MLCEKIMCCKKKSVPESRRTSMNSKKQSIAPTLPPEDTRPKLDESLVDHTSIMKAAIPVLPVGLAWFCLICNCLIPGSGKLLLLSSGLFIAVEHRVFTHSQMGECVCVCVSEIHVTFQFFLHQAPFFRECFVYVWASQDSHNMMVHGHGSVHFS